MSNTTATGFAPYTAADLENMVANFASFGELDALHEVALEMNRRLDEAHEQAHMEDEHRWADAAVAHVAAEDGEAIADLLVRVRRYWRLSREHRGVDEYAVFYRYAQLSGNAATELEEEYGVEIAWTIADGWTIDFEAGWLESDNF